MSTLVVGVGFAIATMAVAYFGLVVYAELVGATVDQLTSVDERISLDEL